MQTLVKSVPFDLRQLEIPPGNTAILQDISSIGDTPVEALQELTLAKQVWLESARAEGKPIPPPTYRPVIYQLKSA